MALSGMHTHERRVALAAVRRLGGSVVAGHVWDARTTHVLFGSVSGRGEKFLAGAAVSVLSLSCQPSPMCVAARLPGSQSDGCWLRRRAPRC